MNSQKISIVIPTRNRPDYLVDSVAIALAHCASAEVVVCDNSDTDSLRHLLAEHISGGRVIYEHCAELRSVVQNFEHALSLATGEWLIFIGDDDAIGPGLSEIVEWATQHGVEAVVAYGDTFTTSYYWPGVRSKYYGDAYASRLFVWSFLGKTIPIDGVAELKRVSARLGGNLGALPRAYHGLVSKSLLDRILKRHGHVFGGVSPDIFSAALIAANSRKSVLVDYPFVIPGTSGVSTAGQGAERSDRAELRQTDHIARFGTGLVWDRRIPEFYAPQTVWAYSLLKALDELPDLRIEPAYGRLYARCLLYCRAYNGTTWRTICEQSQGMARLGLLASTFKGIGAELTELAVRLARRLAAPRAMGNAHRIENLDTISAAYAALVDFIGSSGRTLKLPTDGPQALGKHGRRSVCGRQAD